MRNDVAFLDEVRNQRAAHANGDGAGVNGDDSPLVNSIESLRGLGR